MEGEITLGGVFRAVAALATSTRPGGGFDRPSSSKTSKKSRGMADVATLAEAAEKFGGADPRNSEVLAFVKKTANEAAQRSPARECAPPTIEKARKGPPEGFRKRLETKLLAPKGEPRSI